MGATRRSSLVAGLALTASVFAAPEARADLPTPKLLPDLRLSQDKGVESAPEPDRWASRKKTVALQGGAPGGPVGLFGFSFEYALLKYLLLGTGGGFSTTGARGALMPRLRLPLNRWIAVGFGFPLSLGPYEYSESQREQCADAGCAIGFRTTRTWTMSFWGHLEPGIDLRFKGGLALRLIGGYSRIMNDRSDRCTSTLANGCPSAIGEQKWYGNVALGYAW